MGSDLREVVIGDFLDFGCGHVQTLLSARVPVNRGSDIPPTSGDGSYMKYDIGNRESTSIDKLREA
ncbi:hypothetical protein MSAS_19070 [Mycobacterium saskatchewanense]|nr:hypothetical protein MSAS_19070 [Mycobacterium saskatchewanense]